MKWPLVLILTFYIIYCQGQYVTQITYSDLNFVNTKMQDFMESQMQMVIDGEPIFGNEGNLHVLTIKYSKQAIIGTTRNPHIYFKYYIFDKGPGESYIKSCSIYGDYSLIVRFYASFWPTTINFDAGKNGKIAYNYYWQDKITLSLHPERNSANILIENTTIKSIADFNSKSNKSKAPDSTIKKSNENNIRSTESITQSITSDSQKCFFVNVDNLILRDSPKEDFTPLLILHAPAKLRELNPAEDLNNYPRSRQFAYVEFRYSENYSGLTGSQKGWVMKRYLVNALSSIKRYDTLPPYDANGNIRVRVFNDGNRYTEVSLVSYAGDSRHDPNRFLQKKYLYPKYKGGNETPKK